VPAEATAFPHRYDHHVVWISPVEEDAALDEAMIRWTHECWEALRPHADRAVYVNALDEGAVEGEARVREAYGANYPRLKALRQAMDPTNFFRQNSNIQPLHACVCFWPVGARSRRQPVDVDTSVCSAISSASSTSIPRSRTVLSSLLPAGNRLDYLPRRTMSRVGRGQWTLCTLVLKARDIAMLLGGHFRPQGEDHAENT
jgi:hypothetical protein